jgi:cytochrome P450
LSDIFLLVVIQQSQERSVTLSEVRTIPQPSQLTSLRALRAIIQTRSMLPAMLVFHREVGDVFQFSLPGFSPVVLVGADACRFVLVDAKDDLLWRAEGEPITNLLEQGVLVLDGDVHDNLRRQMQPALHKRMLSGYSETIVRCTDQITAQWNDTEPVEMLAEMRRIALLVLMGALFEVDYTPELKEQWASVLALIRYVSPGLWLLWEGMPHPGYRQARKQIDNYWFRIIAERREHPKEGADMLSVLIDSGLSDELIRDQLMTMLVAGHDTTTAMLAWSFYLLGQHPQTVKQLQTELDAALGNSLPNTENTQNLPLLNSFIQESMRLYPPLHFGSRIAARDVEFDGYRVEKGRRILYSIFLTHRHPDLWERPDEFILERFLPENKGDRPHYAYLPFGGGLRICIGMAFAQVEMRLILARVLQQYDVVKRFGHVHMHMGVTIEPRPGVQMQPVKRKR